jgi:hypothetical protein
MYLNDMASGCGCAGGTSLRTSNTPASSGCGCGGHQCDGPACTCRPRFFDGQLITARDFRRLDQYLVDKSRLHNRYLHGVGVVCGLEVVCNPCDDTVTVRTGYALGPCGEDIVVCSDARVDVASLIEDYRRERVRADCPPYGQRPTDCEAARQKWVLGVCYDERPSGGVTSLKHPGNSCGCGGGCGGACGGGSRRSPAACEPTQICEGYRFTLTKVDPGKRDPADPEATVQWTPDELPGRVQANLARLQAMLTQVPSDPKVEELTTYCCQLKADLRDLMDTGSVYDCLLAQQLNTVVCPAPEDPDAAEVARASIAQLFEIAIALFRMCTCSALLPPCGAGSPDDCVPLAVLTVRTADLTVLEICNWSARKFAATMPTLGYWFGWIPIFHTLRAAVERLCCQPDRRFQVDDKLKVSAVRTRVPNPPPSPGARPRAAGPRSSGSATGPGPSPATVPAFLLAQYVAKRSPMSGFEATVLGAMGAQDPDGDALATPLELANPLSALAVGRLGFDAFDELAPEQVLPRRAGGGAVPNRVASLEEELAKLQKKVRAQDRLIRKLGEKGPGQ